MRVLIVDDVPEIAQLLHLLLTTEEGHEAFVVTHDFDRLLDPGFDWSRFDVLVCDLSLGSVDGMRVLAHVQRSAPRCRRVAFTARQHLGADSVADAILAKGALDLDAILDAIDPGRKHRPYPNELPA